MFNKKKGKASTMAPQTDKDVDVTSTNPLYITDDNRTFNRVTVFPGGQIFVQTTANISIQTLVKQTT